jgi:RNA polymerase sigma-70 factor (family 1)
LSDNVIHTDESLLRLMAAGDTEAFTLLYRRHWESLFITAVKVIQSKEDAADIVQEIFLSLWNRRSEIVITASLSSYLQTSVRYKAIHYIEKNITRRNYLSMLSDLAESNASSPESILQVKEIQEAVSVAVKQMPPKMQEVYLLSRHEYLSHKEIAARLGISEETVKKHIQHAMQLIKTSLGKTSVSLTALLFTLLS